MNEIALPISPLLQGIVNTKSIALPYKEIDKSGDTVTYVIGETLGLGITELPKSAFVFDEYAVSSKDFFVPDAHSVEIGGEVSIEIKAKCSDDTVICFSDTDIDKESAKLKKEGEKVKETLALLDKKADETLKKIDSIHERNVKLFKSFEELNKETKKYDTIIEKYKRGL